MKLIHFFTKKEVSRYGQPEPIKKHIPEWYRRAEDSIPNPDGSADAGLKKCVPFLDAMISGYALTLPFDIYVTESESGELNLRWNAPAGLEQFIMERPAELGRTMPRPAGHHKNHLVWRGFWGMKTPRGWSLLVTHPLNRFDLPFTTTSGLIDSDEFFASGNLPFFIKEGFTGTIPAGTPIAQLIPIKRAKWKHIPNNQGLVDYETLHGHTVRTTNKSYKKIFWHRKEYN